MTAIAIYGADVCGRDVLPIIKSANQRWVDIVFVDDNPARIGTMINRRPVISFEQAMAESRSFTIAIADGKVRRNLSNKIKIAGGAIHSVKAELVKIFDEVTIAEGYVLCDNVILTSNIRIGQHFHANIFSYVEHDCVIGDFVTFAPCVSCNGRVQIEDNVYVGTAAILRQGKHDKPLRIGAGAVIGMGAVVTKDVPPSVTVVGNPARPLVRGN